MLIMTQNSVIPQSTPGANDTQRQKWQKLTVQVVFFVFLPLTILVLVIAFGSTSLHQNAMRSLVGERDERAARSVANAINSQLLHRADLIQSLAIRGREGSSLDDVMESSAYLDQEFDMGLAFIKPDGSLITSKGEFKNWNSILEEGHLPIDEENLSFDSGVYFTKALPFPKSDIFIVLFYATTGPDDPIAVGAFSVASIGFQPLNSAFDPGEHATAILVDSNQQVVFSIGDTSTEHFDASHPGVSEVLAGETGATYFPVNGSEHVTAYSSVPLVEWGVVIEEPWESVTNPVLNTTLLAPLILVPVLILSLIVLWFGARRIVQPLQSLEDQAAKLSWGDFQAIEEPVEGIEEINRLQRTLIHMAHKVQIAQQGLRGYISAITTGQEEERRRLARELHDDTIQSLIALKQRVQLANISSSDQTNGDQLQEIQNMADQTIKDLRRITRDLRPLYLEDLGLVATLEMLSRETSNTMEIPVDFQSLGTERRLPTEIELTLYRMSQEGLSNVARHANASEASIFIQFDRGTTTLTISDDGHGFIVSDSPAEFAPSGHYGLLGLHERAELIGANLEIHSALGHGTRLVITIPSPEDEFASEERT
jgi:two-component system sensor histidine kinase UhpB